MIGLTEIQRETLHYIVNSIRERGYPPTIREMGTKFDMASTNAISDRLRALEKKGYIVRGATLSRGISVTDKGWAEVGGGPPKRKIALRRHEDGFLASLDGDRAQAFGKSHATAIGRLVMAADELLNVEIDTSALAAEAA